MIEAISGTEQFDRARRVTAVPRRSCKCRSFSDAFLNALSQLVLKPSSVHGRPNELDLAEPARVGEKVQEEAEELARAAREESDERVAEEAADVLYHLAVLLRSRGLSLDDAQEALLARRR